MKENKQEHSAAIQNGDDMVFSKARKVMAVYMQSTGSTVCIYDCNCLPLKENGDSGIEQNICKFCKGGDSESAVGDYKAQPETKQAANGRGKNLPCRELHVNAIRESSRRGGTHIYKCSLGLMFWTSPIYSEGRFSCAVRGSGYLDENANAEDFAAKCNGAVSPDEFERRVSAFPKGDTEKIESLAEMLLLCAESLSSGSEDYHEILRRRSEQQRVLSTLIAELKAKYPEGSILPGYPLEKERLLIAALRRGSSAEAIKVLNDLLAVLIFSNQNHFRHIQLRALELVVLLSRLGNNSGGSAAMETGARCLKRIQEAKTIEELTDILHNTVESIAAQISSFQGIPHAVALRKADRYIRENFSRKISLQEIATISGLSAPYFSTIFKEEMGENLSKYLNRLRVEKAGKLLLETDMSLSEIAGACCFEDQSWFSKIFKNFTGLSPGRYRSQGGGIIQEISENNLSEDYLKTIK